MVALRNRNRAVRISVPVSLLYVLCGALVVVLVLGGFLGQYLLNQHTDYGRLNRLVAENYQLKERLIQHTAALDTFRQFLSLTEEMDNRLRCASGLYLIPSDVRQMGVGGGPPPGADHQLDNLVRRMRFQERSLVDIENAINDQKSRLSRIPSIWPVRGWVTSGFGRRRDPFTGGRRMHNGMDIVAPYGSGLLATADGKVAFAGWKSGWGRCIEIDHGNGLRTFFAHCRSVHVKVGNNVKRGQMVARLGSSGRSTGAHLHYGLKRKGVWVNPRNYIVGD